MLDYKKRKGTKMSKQTKTYMSEVIKKFLDERELNYMQPHEQIFTGSITFGENIIKDFKFYIIVDDEIVNCYYIPPITIPAERRSIIGEFITRANYGMHRGNFEMDWNDGELRFRTIVSRQDLLCDETIAVHNMKYLITYGLAIWNRYGENLLSLLFCTTSERSVAELIKQCESEE